MSNPYKPAELAAWARVVIDWEPSTFGRTIVLADAATLEAALDAFALAGDVASLEALTDTAGRHDVSDNGWRARVRFAASFTGAELSRSYAGALALAPTDDDDDDTTDTRS